MKSLIKKYFKITLIIYLLTLVIPSFKITGGIQSFFISTLILTILYYLLRPIINIILLPLNLITLQLTAWIVNIVMFFLWLLLTPNVKVGGFTLTEFNLGSIHLSHLNLPSWEVSILAGILLTISVQCLDWITE